MRGAGAQTPLAYTVSGLCERVPGLGREKVRRLCRSGEVRARKVGADWIICAEDVERMFGFGAHGERPVNRRVEEALHRVAGLID